MVQVADQASSYMCALQLGEFRTQQLRQPVADGKVLGLRGLQLAIAD
jgi:hypothetical protein